jgi:hypothetical protein
MCYSAESSGGTFLFVLLAAAFIAFGKGQPAIALILIVLASMQLLEWVIWSSTPVCTPLNYLASSAIPVVLALHPTLIALILWRYEAGYASPHLYLGLFGLLSVATLGVLLYGVVNPRPSCVVTSEKGHLNWGLDQGLDDIIRPIYLVVMAFLTLSMKPWTLGVTLFTGYLLSGVYYRIRYPGEWPSLWCHGINAGAVVAAIL